MKSFIEITASDDLSIRSRVMIGFRLVRELPSALSTELGERRAFYIFDQKVHQLWYERLLESGWADIFADSSGFVFPFCEEHKRLNTIERLAERLVEAGADRGSALVAVGGGVTGDVVGFLASIYMRGIPCFQVPTTLLAQVDSSVGGKTGVDLEVGKNLLGTFHQPQVVWIDPLFLESLPSEEFRQGMAEVIKTAMIGDVALWNFLETNSQAVKNREPEALLYVVESCVHLKASIVKLDSKESGLRRVLNLGHTVGHAIERVSRYQIRHGDAVAMGLVASARLAFRRGQLEALVLERLEDLCRFWDLPVRIPKALSPDDLVSATMADKKLIGGRLHFVLPLGIGTVTEETGITSRELKEVLADLQQK